MITKVLLVQNFCCTLLVQVLKYEQTCHLSPDRPRITKYPETIYLLCFPKSPKIKNRQMTDNRDIKTTGKGKTAQFLLCI